MRSYLRAFWWPAFLAAAVLFSRLSNAEDNRSTSEALEFFEKRIRPILADNCYNCHSADNKAAGGLRVDDRNGLLTGGGRGPGVVPGNPEESLVIKAVTRADSRLQMPPDSALGDQQIADLRTWIESGAAWPEPEVPYELTEGNPHYEQLKQSHWSWQPLTQPQVPVVQNELWPNDDSDRFVLARLEQQGLTPVHDADRSALLRRVTFDLTGLPPTPEEITAFVSDQSTSAYEVVVDRLLASSAFGEHWGRHWLDIARYGESTGSARNLPYPQAWRYRDYVINAFRTDKAYDQFLREQIAGDLLPFSTEAQRQEQLIATGFLAIGVKDVNQRFKVRYEMDNIDEQIDVVSKAVLGLSVSCARCHDHKFDPIPASEYYALAGIFQSTDLCAGLRNKMGGGGLDYYDTDKLLVLSEKQQADPEHIAKVDAAKRKADAAKAEFERVRESAEAEKPGPDGRPLRQIARQKWNRAQAEYVALTDPTSNSEIAIGVRDSRTPGDTEIRYRGEAEQLGPKVPRGILSLVAGPAVPVIPANQSGRQQLAQWLTDPGNPLTSRVIVNRVWHYLFGAGLVRSTDNFGLTGDKPSHPELLDYLAQRLISHRWSLKHLIRDLVLSHSYRLSTQTTPALLAADPENRLIWRHSPRRLTAEEIRDAQLAASGQLDRSSEKASPANALRVIELRNNGPEARRILEHAAASRCRSVYLPLLRTLVPKSMEVFDFAEQGLVTGNRETTTVPTQALYLLNDAFVRRQALTLARTHLTSKEISDEARVAEAYRRVLGREPSLEETARATAYVVKFSADAESLLADVFSSGTPVASTSQTAGSDSASARSTANVAVAQTQAAQLANPDDVAQDEEPVVEEIIEGEDARTAAWHSFVQALFLSAEFRYLN